MLRNLPNYVGGAGITLGCAAMTGLVIGNAYHQKQQFYPTVVYITKSNTSIGVMYLMAFSLVLMFAKILKTLLFGTLRSVEYEQLIEKFFYAVTETCLAFTVFRDDFSPWFIALFTLLLFMKTFHWLTDFRVDYMERSPVITTLYHVRIATLLVLLTTVDFLLVKHAIHSNITQGVSVQLVFGFEYAVLLTFAYSIGAKYVCHTIDLRSPNPWENKAMYLLYMELIVSFVKCVLYMSFLVIMVYIHNFPLFIIRPMYINFKAFKKALRDNIQSRRAIHNMNTLYPDPTAEELAQGDTVCIICREEMTQPAGVKKLPCGHLFHALCLRSWFQRQQTCPTCRLDVLRPPRPAAPVPPPGPTPAQLRRIEALQRLLLQAPAPAIRPPGATTAPAATATTTAATTTTAAAPPTPANLLLPPMFAALGTVPPMPVPPPSFGPLTTAELLAMEGREMTHVEARLRMLRNTQTLVSAAIVQLTQYQEITNRINLDELIASSSRAAASASTTVTSSASSATATSTTAVTSTSSTVAVTSTTSSAVAAVSSTTGVTSVAATNGADTVATAAAASPVSSAVAASSSTADAAPADSSTSEASDSAENTAEEVRRRRLERFAVATDRE